MINAFALFHWGHWEYTVFMLQGENVKAVGPASRIYCWIDVIT